MDKKVAQEWRGINDFYFVKGKTEEQQGEPVDTEEDTAAEEEESPEVKLIEGKWLPGDEGFQFNKKCIAQVKAEFLKETNRKKVTIDTFVEFEGEEEDLGQQVEAFLDDDGIGEAQVTLFYGEKYSDAIRENPTTTCNYKFIAHHNACEKDIESELLEMPQAEKLIGGASVHICTEGFELIKDAKVTLKAGDEEIFNDTLTDGILEISEIPATDLTIECEFEGKKTTRTLSWMAGESPFTSQVVKLPNNEK